MFSVYLKPTNIMTRCIAFIHIQFPSVALAVKTVRVVSLTSAYFTYTRRCNRCGQAVLASDNI